MKLNFGKIIREQPDPFIFRDGDRFFLYVTAHEGVEAYSADSPFEEWKFEGVVCRIDGCTDFWAPSIIKYSGEYHIYFSCRAADGSFQFMHTARSSSPLGPFTDPVRFYDRFSIDSHVVETEAGLFLWYAEDNTDTDRIGTRVFVDRLLDPRTPAHQPREMIVPTFDHEIFKRNRLGDGRDWHTIEGPFWFGHDGWQYVMYSGACYENETYHIGYAAAKSDECDLTKVDFVKHTDGGRFDPVMIANEYEEGVGHHSVIRIDGEFYAVYHGRDLVNPQGRTARICRLHVKNGVITAERYRDHI